MASEEHEIQKKIQVALSKHHCSVFRVNVGKGFLIPFVQIKGQAEHDYGKFIRKGDYIVRPPLNYFDAGAPKGHPDLYGFRWVDGKVFYIEVKSKAGKPSEDQIRFHNMLTSHNIIHGVARSPQEALMIVDGGLGGYGYE